jgi:hypothetical protein
MKALINRLREGTTSVVPQSRPKSAASAAEVLPSCRPSRRNVLRVASAAVGAFFLPVAPVVAQYSETSEAPQESGASRRTRDEVDPPIPEAATKKAMLEQRQKDIKKDIEKLYDLATQLKAEVEKTDATTTLSLAMVRRAEEVEKLAHQIKENAKG